MNRTTVMLADDHQILRQGLRQMLNNEPDLEVLGEARDGREAVRLARELRPQVVVMDVSMPQLNGVDATRQLNTTPGLDTRVIALSMHMDRRLASEMLRAGARAYLKKDGPYDQLVAAIRAVMDGKTFVDSEVAGSNGADAFHRLSPRE